METRKWAFFTEEGQFHGKCHVCEIVNQVGPYQLFLCQMVQLTNQKMNSTQQEQTEIQCLKTNITAVVSFSSAHFVLTTYRVSLTVTLQDCQRCNMFIFKRYLEHSLQPANQFQGSSQSKHHYKTESRKMSPSTNVPCICQLSARADLQVILKFSLSSFYLKQFT